MSDDYLQFQWLDYQHKYWPPVREWHSEKGHYDRVTGGSIVWGKPHHRYFGWTSLHSRIKMRRAIHTSKRWKDKVTPHCSQVESTTAEWWQDTNITDMTRRGNTDQMRKNIVEELLTLLVGFDDCFYLNICACAENFNQSIVIRAKTLQMHQPTFSEPMPDIFTCQIWQ